MTVPRAGRAVVEAAPGLMEMAARAEAGRVELEIPVFHRCLIAAQVAVRVRAVIKRLMLTAVLGLRAEVVKLRQASETLFGRCSMQFVGPIFQATLLEPGTPIVEPLDGSDPEEISINAGGVTSFEGPLYQPFMTEGSVPIVEPLDGSDPEEILINAGGVSAFVGPLYQPTRTE